MTRIYDITWPLSAATANWPGDTPFHFQWSWQMAEGNTVNVGAVTMSTHSGTHADAPLHVENDAAAIDQLDLDAFLGPARLIDVSGHPIIGVDLLRDYDWSSCPRLLLRTGGWADTSAFPQTIPVIDDDVPAFLQQQGIRLLGLDVPSVDPLESQSLPNHHKLIEAGIQILESLDLRRPPAGCYELIALPLRLAGGDAAPIRAILRRPPPEPGEFPS